MGTGDDRRSRRVHGDLRDLLYWRAPAALALSSLVIAVPLLDLYGRNPTVFVVAGFDSSQLILFALAVAFLPGMTAVGIEWGLLLVSPRWSVASHVGFVALFAALAVAQVMRLLAPEADVVTVVLFGVGGVCVAWLERRWSPVRDLFRFMAVIPVVVVVVFVWFSSASTLLEQETEQRLVVTASGGPPVVFIVVDEIPLVSLVDSQGVIRRDLFPNIAGLADTSNWYRNAMSASGSTEASLPNLLSGMDPRIGSVGTSIEWPQNLFTMLGSDRSVVAYEAVTDLCPSTICAGMDQPSVGYGDFARDALVVLGHQTLTSELRESLPPIDASWGDFGHGDVNTEAEVESDIASSVGAGSALAPERASHLWPVIDAAAADQDGGFYFAHVVFPHWPWQTTPNGRTYEEPAGLGLARHQGGPDDRRWLDDEEGVTFWHQRHLLQVGAADRQLGEVRSRLEATGVWDRAIVVVVADHGASFEPETYFRGFDGESSLDEMYRVPLFIKLPDQSDGSVSDEAALSTDVVPTLVDLLDLQLADGSDWGFDGRSLVADGEGGQERVLHHGNGTAVAPADTSGLYAGAARNERRFPRLDEGEGWIAVAAPGDLSHLVGEPAGDITGGRVIEQSVFVVDVDLAAGTVPVLLSGSVPTSEFGAGDALLVGVNGVIAGVAVTTPSVTGSLQNEGPEESTAWVAMVAESLLEDDDNAVAIVAVSAP